MWVFDLRKSIVIWFHYCFNKKMIQRIWASGYLCKLKNAELVSIESSQYFYIPT